MEKSGAPGCVTHAVTVQIKDDPLTVIAPDRAIPGRSRGGPGKAAVDCQQVADFNHAQQEPQKQGCHQRKLDQTLPAHARAAA